MYRGLSPEVFPGKLTQNDCGYQVQLSFLNLEQQGEALRRRLCGGRSRGANGAGYRHRDEGEVLSYSRSRCLFAGISLEGSTLRSDGSTNKKLYGRSLSAKEIVHEGTVGVPPSGRELISLLDKESPKSESDPVSLKE